MLTNLIRRSCPICQTDAHATVWTEANVDASKLDSFAFASRKQPEYMHHRLMHCSNCDIAYADPLPAGDELGDAYRDAAFDSGEEAMHAARTYGQLVDQMTLPDRDGALDIGTGDGVFLKELLSRGFTNVIGVEPSTAPIEAADPQVKPLIRHGLFSANDAPTASLSLVTCLQTIEHVPDPLALSRDVLSLLKPGGGFLIACHNRRGTVNRILGKRSPILDVEHLQLFSPASARRLLETAGFSNTSVKTYVNRYPMQYWTRMLPIPGGMKSPLANALKAVHLGSVPMPMPAGNLAVVGYRAK